MKKIFFIYIIVIFNILISFDVYAALPKSYNSVSKGYVTAPKEQGKYSTCVSFATVSAIETNLIKNNLVRKNINLSEYQLYYSIFKNNNNNVRISTTYKNFFDLGTSHKRMQVMLGGDFKIVSEQKIKYNLSNPYKTINNASNGNIIIKNSYEILTNKTNIKENIIKYGSVVTSIYYDNNFYNNKTCSYNLKNKNFQGTNHAITIVGWNDNYSKNNFKYKSKENGAWLCKNSWGTNWGNKGYFWLSYETNNLKDKIFIYEADIVNEKYNKYEYDGTYCNILRYKPILYQANIFTSKRNEYLTRIMFYTSEDNCNYKINLYVGNIGEQNNLNNDKYLLQLEGKLKYKGFHSIDLPCKFYLPKNLTFSIILNIKNSKNNIPATILDGDNTYDKTKQILTTKPNRSYILYDNKTKWRDLHSENKCCKIKIATETK